MCVQWTVNGGGNVGRRAQAAYPTTTIIIICMDLALPPIVVARAWLRPADVIHAEALSGHRNEATLQVINSSM